MDSVNSLLSPQHLFHSIPFCPRTLSSSTLSSNYFLSWQDTHYLIGTTDEDKKGGNEYIWVNSPQIMEEKSTWGVPTTLVVPIVLH